MKKYMSFFKIRFINNLQYRAAAYAGIATQFFWGFMEILVFAAFYKSNADAFPMKFQELSSYIWLQQSTIALFFMWSLDSDLLAMITSGGVAYELCRPMDLYNMWYTKNMASRTSNAMLRCVPILFIATLLPKPYGLIMPTDINLFILFIISIILAFLVVISFCMIIYAISFFTVSSMGIRLLSASMAEFFTGAVIPLPFLPEKIFKVISLLPWASMQNVPFRIYSGNLRGNEAIYTILLQVFWVLTLTAIGKLLLNRGLKKVVIQGG